MRTIYTFYADAARIALQSIFAHKLRAFLTLIGIIIGVASVVVVGAAISGLNTDVKEKFFPGQNPIGKTVSVRGLPMTVVGVEEKRGSMFGQSFDKHMYIPLTAYRKIFGGRQSIQIHGKAASREQFDSAIEDARL